MKSSRVVLVSLPSSECEFANSSGALTGSTSTSFAVCVQEPFAHPISLDARTGEPSIISANGVASSGPVLFAKVGGGGVLFKDVREDFLVLSPQLSSFCSLSLHGTVVLSLRYIKAAPHR